MARFAYKPITKVPITEAMIVAMKTPVLDIPVALSIAGLTKIMYAIVKNVVTPAVISVLVFVPC